MSEPKTRPTATSVDAFLARQPEPRRADCQAVVAMMRQATGEPPVLWGDSIVGFGRYANTTSAGTYDWPVAGFSPRKSDLALYLVPDVLERSALMAKLGKHRAGKSCLYIKRLADVDTAVLKRLIETSVRAMASKRVRGTAPA